jgi:hypothetical protein
MRMVRCLAVALAVVLASGAVADADTSDFAMFDGTVPANQPDSGAVCRANSAFTVHLVVANQALEAGSVRITYSSGDFIDLPIAAGAAFAFSQAAGSKGREDKAVRVSNGGSAAQLVGSMSAIGQGNPRCASCDDPGEGGVGDAECDKSVSN